MTARLTPDRFWARVDQSAGAEGCWPWTGYRERRGYGQVGHDGTKAHRMALTLSGVPVPDGMFVLHSCDNPPCCNPRHLRVGTRSDNVRDMYARGRQADCVKPRSHCRRGHLMSPENTFPVPTGGRGCRSCRRDRKRQRVAEARARDHMPSTQADNEPPVGAHGPLQLGL